jgi:4-hydroxy-tetrahydrodipicolinate synthase
MAFARESIKGSIPALITPMQDGKVDERAFRNLVAWQIEQGSHGLVPCGTTGESPTLSHEEHMRVVEICVEEANGRVPVIAGAGSNSTSEAIMLSRHAKTVGADAVLSVTGYYNRPSQRPSTFPSCSTISPAGRSSTSPSRRWRAFPGSPTSSASRTRPQT